PHRDRQPRGGPARPAARPPPRGAENRSSHPTTESDEPMIRKRTSRLLIAPAILAASALAFTACSADEGGNGSTGNEPAPVEGGTLTIYTPAEDMSFDPATSQSLAITSLGLNARRLTAWKVSPDAATEVIPDLATDTGTPSDDGKTWTFTLKDGLT